MTRLLTDRVLLTLIFTMSITANSICRAEEQWFFHVEEVNNEWLLRAPDGEPFYLRGVNHYGDGTYMPWEVEGKRPTPSEWRVSLRDRLQEWGFNYLPPSIGPSAIDPSTVSNDRNSKVAPRLVTRTKEWPAEHYLELEMPFTIFLEVPKQYMAGPGLPDVFSEEFARAVDERCREVCVPVRNSPHLIGYHFCHNPPWHPRSKSFDQWVSDCTKAGSAGRKEWVRLMQRIYGSIDRWRETYGVPITSWDEIETLEDPLRGYVSYARMLEDKEAFMRRVCEQWYRVYHDTIRKYDENHLIFGDRNTLHLQPLPEYAIRVMKPYVDVLSVNVMGPPETVYGVLEQVTRHWDGPIHLADTGAGIYEEGLRRSGYQSRDLEEFEQVYSGMMRMGFDHPQIIGFGWCGFYETPPPGARSGLVDCRNGQPLPDRIAVVKKWNAWMDERYTERFDQPGE